VNIRLAAGALSALLYLACWAQLPTRILGPASIGLVWLSILFGFVTRNSPFRPRWNQMAGISLDVILVLHLLAWHFVRVVPPVDWSMLSGLALATVGPDVYLRMKDASHCLFAFVILLGPGAWWNGKRTNLRNLDATPSVPK
jgi:hypothetical protein